MKRTIILLLLLVLLAGSVAAASNINTTGWIYSGSNIIAAGNVSVGGLLNVTGSSDTSFTGNLTVNGGEQVCTASNGLCNQSFSGTTNTLAKFTSSGTIGDSIISESGSTATVTGTLSVTNNLIQFNGNDLLQTWDTTGLGLGTGQNQSGSYNTLIGIGAGGSNLGIHVTATGYLAGNQNSGDYVTATGSHAAYPNSGSNVVAIGSSAAASNIGNYTTAIGRFAALSNVGNDVTAIGYDNSDSNIGQGLTSIGVSAAQHNEGNNSVLIGKEAGYADNGKDPAKSGNRVIGLGYQAAYWNTGDDVVAIGYQAGKDNTENNKFFVQQANVNAVPLINGSFDTGSFRVNGSEICTAANGLCSEASSAAGWTNTSTTTSTSLDVNVTSRLNTSVPLTIHGASGQTGNLQEWQNSSGGVLDVVDSDGNVGIGTSSPASKLDVDGNITMPSSFFMGNGATVNGTDSLAVGDGSTVNGNYSIAIGHLSNGTDNNVVAIGSNANTGSDYAVAIGQGASANAGSASLDSPIAIGRSASATGQQAIAIGRSARASSLRDFAMGFSSVANGSGSIGIGGYGAQATGLDSVALGYQAVASTTYSTAIGMTSTANGSYSFAAGGGGAVASGYASFALGHQTQATENSAIAIGGGALATNEHTLAIGGNSNASYWHSGAIGYGATALADYQLVIGGTAGNRLNLLEYGGGEFDPQLSTDKGLVVKGAVNQTADLQEWQNSSGGVLAAVNSAGELNLPIVDDASTPTLAFGGDTGFYESGTNQIGISFGGSLQNTWDGGGLRASTSGYWTLNNNLATDTVPSFTFTGDINTGIGHQGADNLSLITGGVEAVRINNSQDVTVTGNLTVNGGEQVCTASNGLCNQSFSDTVWSLTGDYLYNNSGSLDLNETKLNETIDARAGNISGGGTSGKLAKFTATGTIGDSIISESKSTATVSGNLDLQGGNITIGSADSISDRYIKGVSTLQPYNFNLHLKSPDAAGTSGTAGTNLYLDAGAPVVSGTPGNILLMTEYMYGNVGIGTTAPEAKLEVNTTSATTKGLIVKGATSQSANLQEWQNSSGNALTTIDSSGNINISNSGDCIYLPGGGKLCGNSTCTTLYSPDGNSKTEACN